MARLEGKRAFITGAASGIGKAAARLFASEGARLGLVDVKAAHGEALAAAIRGAGGEALFMETDVSDADAMEAVVRWLYGCVQPPTAQPCCSSTNQTDSNRQFTGESAKYQLRPPSSVHQTTPRSPTAHPRSGSRKKMSVNSASSNISGGKLIGSALSSVPPNAAIVTRIVDASNRLP